MGLLALSGMLPRLSIEMHLEIPYSEINLFHGELAPISNL